ncbi:MAG: glycosyltransferase family 2 protein [Acidobacteria bacterium]|nr:glycosyltransferase family 2 protein [Acidobacteriota bacterium]
MEKVTAIIPAGNEENNIKGAIESVLWADEIFVAVDQSSEDKTFEIASSFGGKVRVEKHEYVYSALQKNWAIPKARNNWIFLLDCDERPDEKLIKSIAKTLENPSCDAYEVKRRNFFLGKILRFGGLSNDKVIRLFKRELRYEDKRVHAEIVGYKELGKLKGYLIHHTFKDWDSYLKKLNRYSIWGAEQALLNNQRAGVINILFRPFHRFVKQYILRLGFLDGIPGAVNASLGAYSVFLKYSILYYLKIQKEINKK